MGRRAAAPELEAALRRELDALGMPRAALEVALVAVPDRTRWRRDGGAPLLRWGRPARAPPRAVGERWELSRVMLACRSVLADLDEVPTLVFDEIDAGIGGEAGLAVGARLARLASTRQVVVVTHLPQIACFADRHVRVRKSEGRAGVQALDEEERIAELSRMLAGMESSRHARSHAEELLASARRGSEREPVAPA